jgi:hypothetical protein
LKYIDKGVYGLRLPYSYKTIKDQEYNIIDVNSGIYIPEIEKILYLLY